MSEKYPKCDFLGFPEVCEVCGAKAVFCPSGERLSLSGYKCGVWRDTSAVGGRSWLVTPGSAHEIHSKHLSRQLAQALEQSKKRMLALESLTPSGSEFVGDVQRCVDYVREQRQHDLELIKRFKIRGDTEKVRADGTRRYLRAAQDRADSHEYADNVNSHLREIHMLAIGESEYQKVRAEKAEAEAKRRGDLLDVFCGLRIPELEAEAVRLRLAFNAAVRMTWRAGLIRVVPAGYEDLYDANYTPIIKEADDA